MASPLAIRSRPFSFFRSPPRLRKLSVCGVGQRSIASQSVTPSWCRCVVSVRPLVRFRVPLLSPAIGVGQKPDWVGVGVSVPVGEDEEPLAPMRRADFRRREEARRKSVAHADQVSGDLGKSEAQMMGDILE